MNLQYYPNEAYITNIGALQRELSKTFNFIKTLIKVKQQCVLSHARSREKWNTEQQNTISKSYQQESNVRDLPVGQN